MMGIQNKKQCSCLLLCLALLSLLLLLLARKGSFPCQAPGAPTWPATSAVATATKASAMLVSSSWYLQVVLIAKSGISRSNVKTEVLHKMHFLYINSCVQ